MKFFYPERPTLIHPEQIRDYEVAEYIAEPKYNGSRLELHGPEPGNWWFWNRHHQLMSYIPDPRIIDALDALKLKGYWILDGELRHNKVVGVKHKIVFYDVFVANGTALLTTPFRDRRKILENLGLPVVNGPEVVVGITPQFHLGFERLFNSYMDDPEIEGLVLKRLDGILNLSRTRAVNSAWMRKVRKPSGRYTF